MTDDQWKDTVKVHAPCLDLDNITPEQEPLVRRARVLIEAGEMTNMETANGVSFSRSISLQTAQMEKGYSILSSICVGYDGFGASSATNDCE